MVSAPFSRLCAFLASVRLLPAVDPRLPYNGRQPPEVSPSGIRHWPEAHC